MIYISPDLFNPTSLVAQMVKRLSTMLETWVWSLGREVPWRRKWQPTPVLLPRKFHGRRNLVAHGVAKSRSWLSNFASITSRTLLLSPVTSTTGYCFCFGSIPSFFLKLFLHWSSVAYWAPTDLGSSSFSILFVHLHIFPSHKNAPQSIQLLKPNMLASFSLLFPKSSKINQSCGLPTLMHIPNLDLCPSLLMFSTESFLCFSFAQAT